MKKKRFLPLLLGLVLLMACSNDSDNTPPPDNNSNSNNNGNNGNNGNNNVDRSANLLGAGDSANDLLANTNFDRLVIEIGHVAGFQPTVETLANFEDFILNQSFKENIQIDLLSLSSPEETTLTLQEIVDLENDNRTAYNDGTTLAIYIYFADAPSDSDDDDEGLVTVGSVYRNTSMVIYESTIRRLASRSSTITLSDLETATLNHEFGHLFGLVNLGTDPVNSHEDLDAPNHCNVQGCLMRAEIEFGTVSRSAQASSKEGILQSVCDLSGNSLVRRLESRTGRGLAIIPVLDDECVLDLQNNGGR
ncbi:hypothetical protein [Flagellimonas allohymeniacidonis]|uniref:Membrane metalloprotease n=1 Tax=Flagellimonas allohymeniacidonis TaxID=2517819 RepID=A0A4Q8QGD8_9FLAO|nr:hypothetical protein [Allomuricauda hymeniacidonis]TAI49605.1 hypothetical protein EW142_07350 [Allomuricauda hymeniacidonis]